MRCCVQAQASDAWQRIPWGRILRLVNPVWTGRALLCGWLYCVGASMVSAQLPGPTNTFNVRVTPTNGTVMINLTTNPVFVIILNYTNFTNITVIGSFGLSTNIAFLDTGANPDRASGDHKRERAARRTKPRVALLL